MKRGRKFLTLLALCALQWARLERLFVALPASGEAQRRRTYGSVGMGHRQQGRVTLRANPIKWMRRVLLGQGKGENAKEAVGGGQAVKSTYDLVLLEPMIKRIKAAEMTKTYDTFLLKPMLERIEAQKVVAAQDEIRAAEEAALAAAKAEKAEKEQVEKETLARNVFNALDYSTWR
mmetsp:Transcript_103559/g.297506  ORF Transcript_103559/g.297506 Transcript_103559/m.297506 type:complete len:176 (+) Transcript_103559:66-593(+)